MWWISWKTISKDKVFHWIVNTYFIDSFFNSWLSQVTWTFNSFAIIGWTPTRRINIYPKKEVFDTTLYLPFEFVSLQSKATYLSKACLRDWPSTLSSITPSSIRIPPVRKSNYSLPMVSLLQYVRGRILDYSVLSVMKSDDYKIVTWLHWNPIWVFQPNNIYAVTILDYITLQNLKFHTPTTFVIL